MLKPGLEMEFYEAQFMEETQWSPPDWAYDQALGSECSSHYVCDLKFSEPRTIPFWEFCPAPGAFTSCSLARYQMFI